jgi:hypothetical protein
VADLSHIDEARNDAVLAYRRAIEDGADVVDAVHLAADGAFELGREAGAGDMERIEREARADSFEEAAAMLLTRANQIRQGDPESMIDPTTPAEWQEAVDAAKALLIVDDCMKYGLITGPEVNVGRCEEILRRGKEQGIEPSEDAIERFVEAAAERG